MLTGPMVGCRRNRAFPFSCCSPSGEYHPLRQIWCFSGHCWRPV